MQMGDRPVMAGTASSQLTHKAAIALMSSWQGAVETGALISECYSRAS